VPEISGLRALEVLDSRGRPTVEVTVALTSGATASAGVPSGASTGRREAVELRDGDPDRFSGAGVQRAVMKIEGEITDALTGWTFTDLAEVDERLCQLDGNPDKSRLGANSTVGVSMAVARAMAQADGLPLYRWLAPQGIGPCLPVPHFNVINGGAHAHNALEFQEFMLAPLGAPSYREALRAGSEIYATLRHQLHETGLSTGLGDEGGFAPELATPEDALELLVEAITTTGYDPSLDGVAIALDPAASEFHNEGGSYTLAGESLTSDQLIDRYQTMLERYPIWSIEDGLAEDDWDGWHTMTARLGEHVQLVGDDIFVTNPAIISEGITRGIANAALIKVNQIGTITETIEAIHRCRQADYNQMVSHRSGETTDTFIADLTVALGCGQLKAGAPARGERVAKYNRLLSIEQELAGAPYGIPTRG